MALPFNQDTLSPGPSQPHPAQESVLPWGGGMEGVQGAESPPQVVPGHDWHILRSLEMLCTAPAVIKHSCFPAAPQHIPCRPLTLQPLTYSQSCANTPTRTLSGHTLLTLTHTSITSLSQTFSHLQHTLLHIHIPQIPTFPAMSTRPHFHTHKCPHLQGRTLSYLHPCPSRPEHTP